MSNGSRAHWDDVYRMKKATEVSWYRPHLETSVGLIEQACEGRSASIIDVGGGQATLVDDLLARGYHDLTVLDLSAEALATTRSRLGPRASDVEWICADACSAELAIARYDVWHDRAVFHFLTDASQRVAYVRNVLRSVRPGGHAIVGTFGPEGPERCSGLEVVRYDADALHGEFGSQFQLLRHVEEVHQTPGGREQQFVWCMCRVLPA